MMDLKILNFTKSINMAFNLFKQAHQHVRISQRGREVLRNKALADKVIDAIQANKNELRCGQAVRVEGGGEKISVRFANTI